MDLIVNISLSRGPGERVLALEDIRISDLYAKMPEEVSAEILDRAQAVVDQAYASMGVPEWDDGDEEGRG